MNQKLILENWRRFLKEEQTLTTTQPSVSTGNVIDNSQKEEEAKIVSVTAAINSSIGTALKSQIETIKTIPNKQAIKDAIKNLIDKIELQEEKKKKSGDRCTRIAKRKYDVWPSAYASGAVVKCRQGKIWKGVSENASDQQIDDALLLEEIEIIEEAKKKDYKPNFSKEKEQGLHGWFARNDGKGWVNCRTGGPCGRDSADKGGKYPACRPTKAQCKSAGKGPLRKKKSSSPISWTKKKKD